MVTGAIKNAQIRTSGTGAVYVSGLTGSAIVTSSGTGSVYLNTSSGVHGMLHMLAASGCEVPANGRQLTFFFEAIRRCANYWELNRAGQGLLLTRDLQCTGGHPQLPD